MSDGELLAVVVCSAWSFAWGVIVGHWLWIKKEK